MARKNKKKFLYLKWLLSIGIVSFIVFIGIYLAAGNGKMGIGDNLQEDTQSSKPDSSVMEPENPSNKEEISDRIERIYSLAKEGKTDYGTFVVGKTSHSEVTDILGEPSSKTDSNHSIYEDYPKRYITIGYQNDTVTDFRTMDEEVKKVHYNDIIQTLGKADQVSYYKDDSYNQIILSYDATPFYRLRWVLDKPDESNKNPSVDHTSLIINQENQEAEEQELGKSEDVSISAMSLEEKIGQLIIAGIDGTSVQELDKSLITDYHVGGFILYANNLVTRQQTHSLVSDLKEINKWNKLPLFISVDQEGGRISRLPEVENTPSSLVIGNKNDKEYAYRIGRKIGENVKSFGFNLDYAPVLDINSNPENPVIGDRSFGNNADIVHNMGIQVMKGIQAEKVISVVKHFPGHGDTVVDSHIQLPKVNKSLTQLQNLELIPFEYAINNGADVVMVAHILLPKLDKTYPASMSKAVITDLLRNQLHFDGVVITDDMTMGAIVDNFEIGEAAVDSILAGSDIILVAHDNTNIHTVIKSIKTAVENNIITEDRINESVERVMELKNNYLK